MWCPTQAAAALGHAEGALELGSAGQQRRRLHRQRDARGHVAARAAHEQRPAPGRAHHGVVGAHVDLPVVRQEQVRDPVEPLARLAVLVGDRLVGHVGARHHERGATSASSRWWSGEYGSITPRSAEAGATDSATARAGPPPRDHDRALAALDQQLVGGRELHQLARRLQARRHQGERPVLAALARAQRRHGRLRSARQARWYPPSPLTATIDARAERLTAAASAASPRASPRRSRGPHSGQAFGSAWKRRSAGSSYSARQRRTW